ICSKTTWRENRSLLQATGEKYRDCARDNQNLVTIVDAAHALINPENPGGAGQFGFATTLGPQAYHIIRSSLLSIFLLDPLQGFRHRENTSIEELEAWAAELGAGNAEIISLESLQFRCAGSVQYVDWIEWVLSGASLGSNQKLAGFWIAASKASAERQNIIPFPIVEQSISRPGVSPAHLGVGKH